MRCQGNVFDAGGKSQWRLKLKAGNREEKSIIRAGREERREESRERRGEGKEKISGRKKKRGEEKGKRR